MKTYRIISLDVIGNKLDGFEVNDTHHTDVFISVSEDFGNADLIRAIKNAGFIRRGFQFKSFTVEGETEHALFVDHIDLGPVVQLEFVRGE